MLERQRLRFHRVPPEDLEDYLAVYANALFLRGCGFGIVVSLVENRRRSVKTLVDNHNKAHNRLQRSKEGCDRSKLVEGVYVTNRILPKDLRKPHKE